MDLGLFYFADYSSAADRYRLLLEGARFADRHGFASVWTPERHFHEFGGLFPNPAVTGAAVAAVTDRVAVRAGSVVAPLHHPVRLAEDWSMVDNLSGGRVGISFAPGWHARDFSLAPDRYADRRAVLTATVDIVRRAWRGEPVELVDGDGKPVEVRIRPVPVQPELPVWLTSSGNVATFRQAGELGTGVLTHLLGQDLAGLAEKIRQYRVALSAHQHGRGHVTVMLHTFLGPDRAVVREQVREGFTTYLRTSLGLWISSATDLERSLDLDEMDPEDLDFLVEQAFDRHFDASGLFGTVEDGLAVLAALYGIGVDEVACLIDFVPDTDLVLASLPYLDQLRRAWVER